MIDDKILELFTEHSSSMALNVHPSLLPKLRGAAPIQWAIAKRLPETGATVQQLSKGRFDCGDIVAQSKMVSSLRERARVPLGQ
jgi:methionyl-tRNA formyltransferase